MTPITSSLRRSAAALAGFVSLSACHHHHHHGSAPAPTYSVGGSVAGLNGSLVLRNNGGDDLTVGASGTFKFATALASSAAYAVTVQSQPTRQSCAVANGSGTIANANVTNISVTCTTNTYTIGGSVAGLSGAGLVLQDNGGDDLAVNSGGAFTFPTRVAFGSTYAVSVKTQPANQTCTVSSGNGTAAANVTTVAVNCTINPPAQTVGIVRQLVTSGKSPAISHDGRYLTYQTPGTQHVELQDTCLGNAPASCSVTTTPISVTSNGTEIAHVGNALARTARNVSDDGRFAVFDAQIGDFTASPSVPATTHEVYLRDTCNGQPASCVPATQLISVGAGTPSDRDASDASISSDGRIITFESQATNLGTSNPTSQMFVYTYDTCFGAAQPCTAMIRLASVGANSQPHGGAEPASDESGRFVAFTAVSATSDVTGHDADLYLRDTCVGAEAGCTPSTILVSAPRAGATPSNGYASSASVSNGGRFVLFEATLTDLVTTPDNREIQVYRRDTCIGASGPCTPSTQMISVDSAGNAGTLGPSYTQAHALFSTSGRYVAFTSNAHNLSPLVSDGPPGGEAYVRDTCFGASGACTPTTRLISVDGNGQLITTGSPSFQSGAISGDGHYVVLFGGPSVGELNLALTGF